MAADAREHPLSGYGVDVAAGAALFAFAFVVALFVSRHYTGTPEFYQREFGPAVMVAAGRGFVDPIVPTDSALDDFLQRRRPSLTIDDVRAVTAVRTPNLFQESERYLMIAVGMWWRLAGVSWRATWWVGAVFYGLAAAAVFGLFRLALPRTLSALGSALLTVSPVQLEQMPHLRDYCKVPFLVAALALIALVGLRQLSRRQLVVASAMCGAIVGIGFGFRPDVEIAVPLFVATVALFVDRRPWTGLADKALALASFAVVFLVLAGPVVARVWGVGSNQFHVFLLGYSEPFDATLRLRPSVYGSGITYSDQYVEQVVSAESERLLGRPAIRPSPEYNEASRAYWLALVRHFPGDLATRVIASASGILNLAFENRAPDFLDRPLPGSAVSAAVFSVLRRFDNLGLGLGLLLISLAAGASWRAALFAASQLGGLFTIAALEFERRHVFYLQLLPVMTLLLAALVAWRVLRGERFPMRRCVIVAIAVSLLTFTAASSARAYQTAHLRRMFGTYLDAPKTRVVPDTTPVDRDVVLLRWPSSDATATIGRTHAYYTIEFDWHDAPALVAIGLRYRARLPPDLSTIMTLRAVEGTNRFLFPAYTDAREMTFEGIEAPSSLASTLRVARVDAARLPLPIDLRLAADWSREGLYQTLRQERSPSSHDLQFVDTLDRVKRIGLIGRLASPALSIAPIVFDARVDDPSSRVLTLPPVTVAPGSALVAYGQLVSGGVAFGLVNDESHQWYRRIEVTEPGNFVATVEASDPGRYTPVIANAAPRAHWRNRFTVFRFGVVAP